MEIEVLSEEDRREIRRQNRIRNQRMAIIGLVVSVVILAMVVVGTVFVIRGQIKLREQKKMEEQIQQEMQQEISQENSMEETEDITETEVAEIEQNDTKKVLDDVVDSVISEMSLEEKVAGLFLVTPEGITGVDTAVQAGDGTKTALEKYPVGGIIYFKKNVQSEEQIKTMIEKTLSYSKYPLFIAVDEEGGEVSRLANALKLENVGPMADIGNSGDSTKAYEAMKTVGTYMKEYGFNLDFAPVADVLTNEKNTAIGDRAFSSDSAVVAAMVTSAMEGLEEAGITACVKHFPGLGDAAEDTHNGLTVVDKSLEELKQTELIPFMAAIEKGADMIMVGHVSLPQVTGDNVPATMSKEVISDLLRLELGFNGVVITDAMDMGAITEYYGADEAAVRALKAGADMVLMPEDFELAYEGVLAAIQEGTISEERVNDSLKRIFRIKYAERVEE